MGEEMCRGAERGDFGRRGLSLGKAWESHFSSGLMKSQLTGRLVQEGQEGQQAGIW